MLYYLGKSLEVLGLITVPMAVLVGESGVPGAARQEWAVLALGGGLFLLGWLLERRFGHSRG
ncbi:MAG: hypothetical protein HY722_08120 [Planctomycetes bacterium]|nr:hypothetical protein [Planctomycetota bacterium]